MTAILAKRPPSVGDEPASAPPSGTDESDARAPLLHLPATESDLSRKSFGATLLVVLVAALIARLHDLGDGLWYDEIDTLVHYVRQPLGIIVTTFDNKNQHVLYSVLAHLSTAAIPKNRRQNMRTNPIIAAMAEANGRTVSGPMYIMSFPVLCGSDNLCDARYIG